MNNTSVEGKTAANDAKWLVDILRCVDGSLYTGITIDLSRRFNQHNAGTASRYTRSRLPVVLVYQEPKEDGSHALKRELAIKTFTRSQKESLIRSSEQSPLPLEDP